MQSPAPHHAAELQVAAILAEKELLPEMAEQNAVMSRPSSVAE
jgi:hypothetical protein